MSFNVAIILFPVLFAILSYCLGSVNFAILITKKISGDDIRSKGSKNAGMTNVMRTVGMKPGIITLVGDMVKAVVAVCLGRFILPLILNAFNDGIVSWYSPYSAPIIFAFMCGFFVVFGHIFPIFFSFKGGKGIVTIISALLVINWRLFFIMLAIWLVIFLASRIISLGSVIATSLYPFVTFFTFDFLSAQDIPNIETLTAPFGMSFRWFETIVGGVMAFMVVFMHHANIKRLLKGEEKRLSVKRSDKN